MNPKVQGEARPERRSVEQTRGQGGARPKAKGIGEGRAIPLNLHQ